MTTGRRYPLANLLEATGLSLSALAQRVGIGGGEYARVRTEGVSELAADRWANRMGLNPWEVWSDFGYEECAAEDCNRSFVSSQPSHRYCSASCSSRDRRRRRYQTDPAYRDTCRARSAAYYEECRSYVRARQNRQRRAA